MRLLPEGMQTHLNTGATTLSWCWRITRRDGVMFGFTDHDRDLEFDGTTFEADTGMTAGELKSSLGLSVDNVEVDGAMTSDQLSDADLSAGLFDNASIEVFRVNWTDVNQRLLMRSGSLGEVRRADNAFTVEVRGLAHHLQQPRGRLYQYTCDAVLGDAKCGINLSQAPFAASVTVDAIRDAHTVSVVGAETYADGWFARGMATVTSGDASGTRHEIKVHRSTAAGTDITFWSEPVTPLSVGDTVNLTAGCDKHLETCKSKFANADNFRGFPYIPGSDTLTRTGG
ncbi:MAG: DUF2163 domain-containing protein [Pseudomonadota bacterium]